MAATTLAAADAGPASTTITPSPPTSTGMLPPPPGAAIRETFGRTSSTSRSGACARPTTPDQNATVAASAAAAMTRPIGRILPFGPANPEQGRFYNRLDRKSVV